MYFFWVRTARGGRPCRQKMELGLVFACIIVALAVFWPALYNYIDLKDFWQQKKASKVWWLPRIMFPVLWWLIFGMVAAAEIIHLIYIAGSIVADVDSIFVAIICLYAVNITLMHYLSICFFREKGTLYHVMSIINSIILILTAITLSVLYALGNMWVSFSFFVFYSLWLMVVAFGVINWYVQTHGKDMSKKTDASPFLGIPPASNISIRN